MCSWVATHPRPERIESIQPWLYAVSLSELQPILARRGLRPAECVVVEVRFVRVLQPILARRGLRQVEVIGYTVELCLEVATHPRPERIET